jgi:hypothetical protein
MPVEREVLGVRSRARQFYTDRTSYKRLSRAADDAVAQLVLARGDAGGPVAEAYARFKAARSKFEGMRSYRVNGKAVRNIDDDRAVVLRLAVDNEIRRALQGGGKSNSRGGSALRAIRDGAKAYTLALERLRAGQPYEDLYDTLMGKKDIESEVDDLLDFAAEAARLTGQRRRASESGDRVAQKKQRRVGRELDTVEPTTEPVESTEAVEMIEPEEEEPDPLVGKRREREDDDTEVNDGIKRKMYEPLVRVAPLPVRVADTVRVAPLPVPGPGGAMPVVSTMDREDAVPVPDLPGNTADVAVTDMEGVDPEATGTLDDARDELAGDAPEVDVAKLTADVVAEQVKESAVYVPPEQQAALLDQAGAALAMSKSTPMPKPASTPMPKSASKSTSKSRSTVQSTSTVQHAAEPPITENSTIDKLVRLAETQTELLTKISEQQQNQQQRQQGQQQQKQQQQTRAAGNTDKMDIDSVSGSVSGSSSGSKRAEPMAGVLTQSDMDKERARQQRLDQRSERPVRMDYTRAPAPQPDEPGEPMDVDRPGEVFGEPQTRGGISGGAQADTQTVLGVYDPAYSAQDRKRAIEIEARRQREARYYEQSLPGKVFSLKKTVAERDLTSMYSAIDTKIVATRNCIARAVGIATDTSEDITLEPTEFEPFRENLATAEPGERGSMVRQALAKLTKSTQAARAWEQWSRATDMYFSMNNRIKYGPIVAEASQALVVALSGLSSMRPGESVLGAYAGKMVNELQILAATCRGVSYFTKMRDMAGKAVEKLT